ncbi:MAG: ABC-type dipeptide transport system periplasmic component [Lachnoclostridium sp.]|jgi:peptide/nickel transport system substrate-binding protein
MKKRGKFITAIVTVTVLFVLNLAGCGYADYLSKSEISTKADNTVMKEKIKNNEPETLPAAAGGEIVLGSATELNNFDPFTSVTADVRSVNFNIFEGLVRVEPDGSFSPAIASDYEISDDNKTYVFTLRKGVKFHNGKEVTADDVLYSVQKAIDRSATGYDQIDGYEINDDGKLVIHLSKENPNFLPFLTQAIVPKDYTDHSLHPVGTGPYKLTEYAEQDHITLEKNEDYWGKGGYLDKITVKFAASQADLLILFEAGTIDGFNATAATVNQISNEEANIFVTHSNAVQLLALNNNYKPLQDKRVRQAINYAVSADEIIDMAFYGYGTKIGSGLIPGLEKYYDDSLADAYGLDYKKAKELLNEAGYKDGFSLTITVPSVYQAHIDTAEVIVNELAQIGIQADIKQVDWATWLEKVYKGREYEATVISLDGSLAYPTAFLSRYQSDAPNNFINFKSEAYDKVYSQAIATGSEEERIRLFKEAQKILSEEAASVFIQDIAGFMVYNKNYAGYTNYPLYATDYSSIYRVAKEN